MEQKPAEKQVEDLRLNNPFPSLLQFAKSFNLKSLDEQLHSHVPYIVILLQAADEWRASVHFPYHLYSSMRENFRNPSPRKTNSALSSSLRDIQQKKSTTMRQ